MSKTERILELLALMILLFGYAITTALENSNAIL